MNKSRANALKGLQVADYKHISHNPGENNPASKFGTFQILHAPDRKSAILWMIQLNLAPHLKGSDRVGTDVLSPEN
jgi:hypothetical protein